jgi:hypothetical protein
MTKIANAKWSSLQSPFKPALFNLAAGLAVVFSLGCSSSSTKDEISDSGDKSIAPTSETYDIKIEKFSAGDSKYAGFYNNFEYKATLLNSRIRDELLKRQTDFYQWDREKTLTEQAKRTQELASETVVFMSFFTPDRLNDNLSDSKSIWRVYLEAGGHRYEGKIKKLRLLRAELEALYPYHTRWNTPYQLTFAVPTIAIETQGSVLTVTGPLGTRSVTFRGL